MNFSLCMNNGEFVVSVYKAAFREHTTQKNSSSSRICTLLWLVFICHTMCYGYVLMQYESYCGPYLKDQIIFSMNFNFINRIFQLQLYSIFVFLIVNKTQLYYHYQNSAGAGYNKTGHYCPEMMQRRCPRYRSDRYLIAKAKSQKLWNKLTQFVYNIKLSLGQKWWNILIQEDRVY